MTTPQYTIARERSPFGGSSWVVRRDGSRVGSAPTKTGAEGIVADFKLHAIPPADKSA